MNFGFLILQDISIKIFIFIAFQKAHKKWKSLWIMDSELRHLIQLIFFLHKFCENSSLIHEKFRFCAWSIKKIKINDRKAVIILKLVRDLCVCVCSSEEKKNLKLFYKIYDWLTRQQTKFVTFNRFYMIIC